MTGHAIEKYVFEGGMEALKELKFPIGDVLEGRTDCDKSVLREAMAGIISAATGKRIDAGGTPALVHGRPYPKNAVMFSLSAIMLKAVDRETVTKKYALAHSIRAEKRIESEILRGGFGGIVRKLVLGVRIDEPCMMPVSEYLRRAVHIGESKWSLVNRRVEEGMVLLAVHEMVRLLRWDITSTIEAAINEINVTERTAKLVEDYTRKIMEAVPKQISTNVGESGWPPCIRHAIKYLYGGGNLNHTGRFMLASYLVKAGVSKEVICGHFVPAPDYNERVTSQQVEHIRRGKYIPPSCAKLETLGLCHRNRKCGSIRNPIQYRQ